MHPPARQDIIFIVEHDMWLPEAHAVIGDVTLPSDGVGGEFERAEELGKPILGQYYELSPIRAWQSAWVIQRRRIELKGYRDARVMKQNIDSFMRKYFKLRR